MALSKIVENSLADSAVSSAKLKDFAAAVDLNGVELVLDADADTSITADTDDRIDFKIANVEHFSFSNSSGDTIIKPMVDAKDIKFQQYDGRTLLDINDAGFVGIENGATGPGAIRIFEDSDLGSNYVGLSVGNVSTAYTLVFPNADGSSGQALTTNGSGVLSFTTLSANTPSSADGQALGSASLEWSDLFLADASTIQFGNDQDVVLTHVADTGLLLSGTNVIQFNDASQNIGAPSATVLDINATDEIELNATLVDVNANLDVSGTVTATGTSVFASLDISGDIDVDGTTNLDAVDIDGAVQLDATLTVGANDQGYDVILYGDTASANMTWDTSVDDLIFNGAARIVVPDGQLVLGSTAVTSTAAELNIVDGGTSATSTTVADADRVVMNDNGTMVQVAVTDLSAYFDDEITAMPNLVTVGAANTLTTVAGIPFYQGDTGSIYTHDVSGTDDTAQYNTAYGLTALDAITTGDSNTAIGWGVLTANTTATSNTSVGQNSMAATTTGSYNQALGVSALAANTTGARNIAIGYQAMTGSDTEDDNIAIGYQAMTTNNAGGIQNIALGNYALDALTSGDDNVAIGLNSHNRI